MSRVLTFSRHYPSYHPRKGEETFFVEKIWKGLYETTSFVGYSDIEAAYNLVFPVDYSRDEDNIHFHLPKYHTIRAGNRWKSGDWFSPRVWSGAPYRSKQVIIAPDIEVKKISKFEIADKNVFINDYEVAADEMPTISQNDGLSFLDLMYWFKFPKPFVGQIICWNDKIQY